MLVFAQFEIDSLSDLSRVCKKMKRKEKDKLTKISEKELTKLKCLKILK